MKVIPQYFSARDGNRTKGVRRAPNISRDMGVSNTSVIDRGIYRRQSTLRNGGEYLTRNGEEGLFREVHGVFGEVG